MTACPTLLSERLILRPLEESDLDDYTELLATPEVRQALHLPETFSRRDAWLGMAQWRGQWELRGTGQFALEERATGRFVGRAGLHRPEQDDWPGVEVGWTLHPEYWGRGFATEAGAASLAYAFGVMGLSEVFSVILPENLRSQAVAGRLGLTQVEQRVLSSFPSEPHGIWRIGREQWEESPASRANDGTGPLL
ncbi:MAG TPA: GNAT family N-acetyltransferase [Acidimicrobiales bacterium]|jgi:RimJ/RimL family protein N-acetyltransferase|nr:GNAT family N-acetyltransferase [Acidimicrobiales bacterium]